MEHDTASMTETSTHLPQTLDPKQEPKLVSTLTSPSETNFFRSCSLCANGKAALVTDEARTISVYQLSVVAHAIIGVLY